MSNLHQFGFCLFLFEMYAAYERDKEDKIGVNDSEMTH